MPLIDGFGDEVVFLLAVLGFLLLIVAAWASTHVVDAGTLVSVVILDRERLTAGLLNRMRQRVLHGATELPEVASVTALTSGSTTEAVLLDHPHPTQDTRNISLSTDESVEENLQQESGLAEASGADNNHLTAEDDARLQQKVAPLNNHEVQCGSKDFSLQGDSVCENVCQCPTVASSSSKPEDNPLDKPEVQSDRLGNASKPDSITREEEPNATDAGETKDNSEEQNSSIPEPGQIRIKLQYVDGRQRMVTSDPDSTVGIFKRTQFSSQLSDGRSVRFIVNGQELRDESLTLRACSVSDGSVIHCLVTQPTVGPSQSSASAGQSHSPRTEQWDVGILMFPLFGSILVALWYARVMYRGFFNAASTFSLIAISFLYIIGLLASLRTTPLPIGQPHLHTD